MEGKLYGVGVGPGDPELLTVKAVKAIESADVIVAPTSEKKNESMALAIARSYVKEKAEIVKLVFPMVNHGETVSAAWEENKNVILDYLQKGNRVVFLTLGDPMFYSTFIYVFRLLQNSGFPIINVPGVPAYSAVASKLGYPLAEGNDVVNIAPATCSDAELDEAIRLADSLVLMKVYKNFDLVVEKLRKYGHIDTAVMASKCGLEGEDITYDLAEKEGEKVNYLSTIISRRGKTKPSFGGDPV